MSRSDNTADNKLVTVITNFLTELDEFKNRQRTSGRSGILGYVTQNSTTWDLTGTVGADTDTSSKTTNFTAKFTGDGSHSPVIANLSFEVWVQMGVSPVVQLTPAVNTYQDGTGRDADLNLNTVIESQTAYQQTFYLLTDKKVKYFIKAHAVGSSPGTVQVTSP